ncbi:MAG: hypothetical protein ACK5BL_13175, partial [Flavobacteriales bacterium]
EWLRVRPGEQERVAKGHLSSNLIFILFVFLILEFSKENQKQKHNENEKLRVHRAEHSSLVIRHSSFATRH